MTALLITFDSTSSPFGQISPFPIPFGHQAVKRPAGNDTAHHIILLYKGRIMG
jgi:hypothetical protein